MPKIIAHYQREDEPRGSDCASQHTANLGFPNARMVAHRHLNDAEPGKRTLENHFNRPAISGFFERERA